MKKILAKSHRRTSRLWMQSKRLVGVLLIAAPVAACGAARPASVSGGECRIFRAPTQAVKGADTYTEYWLDDTVEAGVVGCGWKRQKR